MHTTVFHIVAWLMEGLVIIFHRIILLYLRLLVSVGKLMLFPIKFVMNILLDIRIECKTLCRYSVLSQYFRRYPESLAIPDWSGYLPLHWVLTNTTSSISTALMMMEKYPAAVRHPNHYGNLPIHIECIYRCRPSILSKFIKLYPESLAKVDRRGLQPLHRTLLNNSSSIASAMVIIERYPVTLRQRNLTGYLPIHIECKNRCRPTIISKCIELYPKSLDGSTAFYILNKVTKKNFHNYAYFLSIIFTKNLMNLYARISDLENDIRVDPHYRRRILNLLPRHIFTSTHRSDYRDLNWQPRAAMMMLLSLIKIQHLDTKADNCSRYHRK
jgi:ankyrin repeat protein